MCQVFSRILKKLFIYEPRLPQCFSLLIFLTNIDVYLHPQGAKYVMDLDYLLLWLETQGGANRSNANPIFMHN